MATDSNVEFADSSAGKSALERFLDNFLRESSIKWMLMIGAAIVASSSLMLVTEKWSSWPTAVKYLTILCYTAATYGIAEFCGRRLRLQATSQVLKLLTLLLIPIGFMALSWPSANVLDRLHAALPCRCVASPKQRLVGWLVLVGILVGDDARSCQS